MLLTRKTETMKNFPTAEELRVAVKGMTKEEMIILRDKLESNWSNNLRPIMQILSLGCINKFNVTLVSL
jgi:hypothetical protein